MTQRVVRRPAPVTQIPWHKALRRDPSPWHDALRTGPRLWQNVLRRDPPPWDNALCTDPPTTQSVAHKAPPMTQRVAPAPVTQGADRLPPSRATFWQWTLLPLGWGVVLASLVRSPPNWGLNPPRTRWHKALRDTRPALRPPANVTQSVVHRPPLGDTRRCATQGVVRRAPRCDTRRRAQAAPDTRRCAPAPPRWHKALHITRRCAHAPQWHKALCTGPPWDLSPWLTGKKSVARTTKPQAHAPPPLWHKALCTGPPPGDTRRCAQPVTQGVVHRPPLGDTRRCATQGVTHTPSHDTKRCAQGPPGWHKALCAGPSPNKALCTRPPLGDTGRCARPSRRHAHNALRACPPRDTMRCAHGTKKATRAQPPTPQNAKQA